MAKTKLSITVDKDTLVAFRQYCKENAYKFSAKIELMMKQEAGKMINVELIKLYNDIMGKKTTETPVVRKVKPVVKKKVVVTTTGTPKMEEEVDEDRPVIRRRPRRSVPSIDYLRRIRGV